MVPVGVSKGSSLSGIKNAGGMLCTRSPKKPGGRNANHGEWLPVDDKTRADDRRIFAEFFLPGAEAHHGYRGCPFSIVVAA